MARGQAARRGQRCQRPATAPQLGGREGNEPPEKGMLHSSMAVSKAMVSGSVLHVGATGLSKIFIPSLFSTTISTADCLARVSTAAAIVLTHHSHCPTLLLGDWAKQEAASEMVFFASEQTFPSLASSSCPVWTEGPALTSHHIYLSAWQGQEKAKQPEAETSFRHNQFKNTYFSD